MENTATALLPQFTCHLWGSGGAKKTKEMYQENQRAAAMQPPKGGRWQGPRSHFQPQLLPVVNPGLDSLLKAESMSKIARLCHLQGTQIILIKAFVSRERYRKL